VTAGFEAVSVPAGTHMVLPQAIGPAGSATIGAGATLELAAADSGSVTFSGPTGTLIVDHSSSFSAQVLNLTGNGNLSGSDQIDLKDIAFGTGTTVGYVGTASGGTLTVSDAQNHTAKISLAGDYTHSTFSLSSDGQGGTVVIDPPGKPDAAHGTLSFSDPNPTDSHTVSVSPQNGGAGYIGNFTVDAASTADGQDSVGWHFNFDSAAVTETVTQSYDVTVADTHANGAISTVTQSVSVTMAGSGNDSFVFHPGVGPDVVVNAASTDSIELDGFSAVADSHQLAVLLNDAQTGQAQSLFQSANGGNDTVINLGNHDSITLQNVHLADLHASNFIIH
jgi:VCBS repeat-containing protein